MSSEKIQRLKKEQLLSKELQEIEIKKYSGEKTPPNVKGIFSYYSISIEIALPSNRNLFRIKLQATTGSVLDI